MVPVLFAYGGWQTASFVSGEMRDPRRDLPRGLMIGVVVVIALYLTVTFVCLRVLGVDGLAQTSTPASEVMRRALGDRGARLIALGIAISTVGFLSQSILTAPRVYYAMARDGVFFRAVGQLDARSRVPVIAIVLQGVWAAVIALTGKYDQILNYVVSIDVLFFGLTGASLLIFRAASQTRRRRQRARRHGSRAVAPDHDDRLRAGVLGRLRDDDRPVPAERRYRRRDSPRRRRRLPAVAEAGFSSVNPDLGVSCVHAFRTPVPHRQLELWSRRGMRRRGLQRRTRARLDRRAAVSRRAGARVRGGRSARRSRSTTKRSRCSSTRASSRETLDWPSDRDCRIRSAPSCVGVA